MKTKIYDTIRDLNQAVKRHCRDGNGPYRGENCTEFKSHVRKIIGMNPVLAESCHDNLVLQFDDDPERLTVNLFYLVVFRRIRVGDTSTVRAVACIDVYDHDPDVAWPGHRTEIGNQLTAAGIEYVVIPTQYVRSPEYLNCMDFKRRIRRAVFSEKLVKFKPYPPLPLQPKRIIKGPSCR